MLQRQFIALSALVLVSACGSESGDPAVSGADPAARSGMSNSAEAGAADSPMSLVCGEPFTPEATPATLAAVFGRENIVPETIDGPEGDPLNITAIYPKNPMRRIELMFRNEEERTGLMNVQLREGASLWTGPNGVKIGDSLEALEAANGGPFQIVGFGWDYGGYVTDWQGGKLAQTSNCAVSIRLAPEAANIDDSLMGDGVQLMSNDPKVRASGAHVTLMGIGWTL